jgi:hypothetical protein
VHFLRGVFEFGKDFIAKDPWPPDSDTGTGNPHCESCTNSRSRAKSAISA